MAGVLDELADYLAAQGITTPAYSGRMPDSPDDVVALYAYAGPPPQCILGQALPIWEDAAVQVVSRSASWSTALATARACWQALGAIANATLGTTRYSRVKLLQSPFELARDVNERVVFAFNLQANRVPT